MAVRYVSVGGERQRVPETAREIAGQSVAGAVKSLRLASAANYITPDSLCDPELALLATSIEALTKLAKILGYEVRS